jgi:hypothetical protein
MAAEDLAAGRLVDAAAGFSISVEIRLFRPRRRRRICCRIEKVFGTCKRSYGLRRMRWLGLAKGGLQVRLTAIAYNLRRTLTLLHAAA